MTDKVIFVSYMRLSDKVARDWYIDYLITKGIAVEFWDVVPLLFGSEVAGSKQTHFLRVPLSYQEVQSMVRRPENKGARYLMLVSYEGRFMRLYRILSQYDCRMFFVAWGAFPNKRSFPWSKLVFGLSHPLQMAKKVYFKLLEITILKLRIIKPFEIVFAAGRVLTTQSFNAVRVIPINLVDYDHFNKAMLVDKRLVSGRYVVFLDIYLPYHTDLKIVGMQAIDPSGYYASLNRFFNILESKQKIKVVIAAHPKARYSANQFSGREIYYEHTPELVKNSDYVISHHSTAISYAVLNMKPIVFIYTNQMANLYEHTVINSLRTLAAYLDVDVHNIDEIEKINQINVNRVNIDRYDEYKYSYLTSPESENSSTCEIFYRQLFPTV